MTLTCYSAEQMSEMKVSYGETGGRTYMPIAYLNMVNHAGA
jgi:hypothetical protein